MVWRPATRILLRVLPAVACVSIWLLSHLIVCGVKYVFPSGVYYAFTLTPGEMVLGRFVDPSLDQSYGFDFSYSGARTYKQYMDWASTYVVGQRPTYRGQLFHSSQHVTRWGVRRFQFIVIPCWLMAGLAIMCSAILVHFHVRKTNVLRRGLCGKCGYNLRGLLEPRCPECGTQFQRRGE